MGQTLSDINRATYHHYRMRGMNHIDAMRQFPSSQREQVLRDLEKSDFESHFGKPRDIIITLVIIGFIASILSSIF